MKKYCLLVLLLCLPSAVAPCVSGGSLANEVLSGSRYVWLDAKFPDDIAMVELERKAQAEIRRV